MYRELELIFVNESLDSSFIPERGNMAKTASIVFI